MSLGQTKNGNGCTDVVFPSLPRDFWSSLANAIEVGTSPKGR